MNSGQWRVNSEQWRAPAAIPAITGATPTDTDTHGIQLAEDALYLWSLSLIIRSFSITDKDFWQKFMTKLLKL